MSDAPQPAVPAQTSDSSSERSAIVVVVVVGIGVLLFAALGMWLALNPASTSPAVRVVRDLMIVVLALELAVVVAAVIVFLVQAARLLNLVNNELQPLISSTSETINAVRGTAAFLSKNLADPVIQANSVLRGVSKMAGDMDALRTAAGIFTSVVSSTSPASTQGPNTKSPDTAGVAAQNKEAVKTASANAKTTSGRKQSARSKTRSGKGDKKPNG